MNTRILFATAFTLIALVATIPGQTTGEPVLTIERSKEESEKELAKKAKTRELALQMLRETARDIESLRTPENRISMSADLAGIMWTHDPDEAKEMFRVLTNSFIQLFTDYSSRLNSVGWESGDEWDYSDSESGKAARRMVKAFTVRENLARAAAERDPLMALDFVTITSTAVRGGVFAERVEESDTRLKILIVDRYAARETETAREIGRRLLKEGFDEAAISLLRQLRAKDAKEGAEFAAEVFSAAGRDLDHLEPNFGAQASLLRFVNEDNESEGSDGGGTELIGRDTVRSHADSFGRAVLRQETLDTDAANGYAMSIRPFSPGLADRIEKKFTEEDESVSPETARLLKLLEKSRESDLARMAPPPPPAGVAMTTEGTEDEFDGEEPSEQEMLLEELAGLKKDGMTDEAKQAIISKARTAADGAKNPMEKIGIMTAAALTMKNLGEDELAMEVMNEASGFVTSNPKNYMDFLNVWILSGGLVQVAPERAFGRLEDAIFRINDVINAGITIAEFIDTNDDIVQDGELLIGAFAGGMTANLSRSLPQAGSVLVGLADADFARTKALADRFDRPEIRVLAKTMILAVVLAEDDGEPKEGIEFLTGK